MAGPINSDNMYAKQSIWDALASAYNNRFGDKVPSTPPRPPMHTALMAPQPMGPELPISSANRPRWIDDQTEAPPQAPSATPPPMASAAQPMAQPAGPPLGQMPIPQNLQASTENSGLQALLAQLDNKGSKYLGQQEVGIHNQEELLKNALGQKAQLDLSPLMSLADAWSGSKLAQGYKGPSDPQATVQALEGALQKGRNDLSENEIALLKSKLGVEGEMMASSERSQDRKLAAQRLQVDKDLARGDKLNSRDIALGEAFGKSKDKSSLQGIVDVNRALNNYMTKVNKFKARPYGEGSGEISSAYNDLTLAYKNAAELGALSGPDVGLIQQNIGNLGDFKGWAQNWAKGGPAEIEHIANDIRRRTAAKFTDNANIAKKLYPSTSVHDVIGMMNDQLAASNPNVLGSKDLEAIKYAKDHPNDPYSKQILAANGVQ